MVLLDSYHRSDFLLGQNRWRDWKSPTWRQWWGREAVIYLNSYHPWRPVTQCVYHKLERIRPTLEDCHANAVLWRVMYLPDIFLEVCGWLIINRVVLMSLRPRAQSPGEQAGVPKSQMFSPTFLTFIWPLNTFLNYTNKYLLSFFYYYLF